MSLEPTVALDIAWTEIRKKDAQMKMDEFLAEHLRGIRFKRCVLSGEPAHVIIEQAGPKTSA